MALRTSHRSHESRGFTLIELLTALAIMALLALASWRGLDGMVRAQERTRTHADAVLVLQTVLAQWAADLNAVQGLEHTEPLAWDGQTLRLTRRSAHAPHAGMLVVAWTLHAGQWWRWQSAPVRTRGQWQQAWQRADEWGNAAGGATENNTGSHAADNVTGMPQATPLPPETTLLPLQEWQLFYWRDGAWSNALSSAGNTGRPRTHGGLTETAARIPEGVRVQLTLPAGGAVAGVITRDWVNPLQAGGKS